MKLKLCSNCKWSQGNGDAPWLYCVNPDVVVKDGYALSRADVPRTDCADERSRKWPHGPCGRRGAKYEEKPPVKVVVPAKAAKTTRGRK